MDRYHGKRFIAFLITVSLLYGGFLFGGENYSTLATALGLIYSAYAGGQTATDWKNGKEV